MYNTLFYFTWQLRPTANGVFIDALENAIKNKENKILYIYCDGQVKPCITNPSGDKGLCSECVFNSKISLGKYRDRIDIKPLSNFLKYPTEIDDIDLSNYCYNSISDIKQLEYLNINIGLGALSTYFSITRNLDPILDEEFRDYFNHFLKYEIWLINIFEEIVNIHSINNINIFNGRMADIRPVFELAQKKKINTIVFELIRESNDVFYKQEFLNALPHSISENTKIINQIWENNTVTIEDKIKIGSSFFERRRKGILTRDLKVFIKNQQKGLLPDSWNKFKKNIVIFNSSEDEFAAIGDEFDKYSLFKTQEEAIIEILTQCDDDINFQFYLRIHPNLKNINYGYHMRLYELPKLFKNIEIIEPLSAVSTYDIADEADINIVFGSSVGVEACFWGSPVINLAGTYYYNLNVAYTPKNKVELFDLINTNELQPKPKINAIKYGYFLMKIEQYTKVSKYSPVHLKLFGKYIGSGFEFLKIINSMYLFKLFIVIARKFKWFSFIKSNKKAMIIPIKGN
jgi:hypothetical protein